MFIRRIALTVLSLILLVPAVAQDDNTFRFGVPFVSGDYDPVIESDDGEVFFFDLVFDALLQLDAEGNYQPRLATDWTLTDESIEFTLREDAVFSDGIPFNADVAVANLERALSDGSFATKSVLRAVTGVEALDEYTLRVTHDNSDPFILSAFADYPAMMVSPEAFEQVGQNPIGTGPYTLNLDETILGSFFVYDRNPDHWASDTISIDRVEIRVTNQPDLVNGLLSGDLDGILVTDGITRTIPDEDFSIFTTEVSFYALAFWDREGEIIPELADPDVRCAIAQAIDSPLYNEAITGVALQQLDTIPPTHWYGASGVTKPAYDPDAARAALEEAGATGFTLPMTTFPAVGNNHQALVGFLTDVGIDVETVNRDNSEVYPYILGGNSPAGYINMNTKHFSQFVESHVVASGAWNPLSAVDDDIVELIEEARSLSLDEAETVYQEISRLINERCYFVPLSIGSTAVYLSPDVIGGETRYRTNGFINPRELSLDR